MQDGRGRRLILRGSRGQTRTSEGELRGSTFRLNKNKRFLKFELPGSRAGFFNRYKSLSLDRQTKRPAYLLLIFAEGIHTSEGRSCFRDISKSHPELGFFDAVSTMGVEKQQNTKSLQAFGQRMRRIFPQHSLCHSGFSFLL